MHIDKGYKGVAAEFVTLFDDGMCDGPTLKVGEQYLMYTIVSEDPKADIPSRGCTRSRHVKYAAEDLEYLNGLSSAGPTGVIQGQAFGRRDSAFGNDEPLPGASIEVSGEGRVYNTTTDADGRYSVRNLDPATYRVAASHSGYTPLAFSGTEQLRTSAIHAGGCAEIKVILIKQWRGSIQGRLIRADGSQGPEDVSMALIHESVNKDGRKISLPGEHIRTGGQGEFSFSNLTPGKYKILMNAYSFPTARVPYPQIYWPDARDEASAREIEIKDEDTAVRYDFLLPTALKMNSVTGVVLKADGTPAAGAQVTVTSASDGYPFGGGIADESGQFSISFGGKDGIDYRLSARLLSQRQGFHSADAPFSLNSGAKGVTLIVDRPGLIDADSLLKRKVVGR
jgi:hypothetical protein